MEAALALGLDRFTMKGVADELGTTIATLYSYVRDRDHLFRLAADEAMARMTLPVDVGQHWSLFLREFADAVGTAMIADVHILDRLIHWGTGLETELRLGRLLLDAMQRRGFEAAEAQRILRLIGAAGFGAAVRTHCTAARVQRYGAAQQAPGEAAADGAAFGDVHGVVFEGGLPLLQAMIEPLLVQIAHARGESLPTIA